MHTFITKSVGSIFLLFSLFVSASLPLANLGNLDKNTGSTAQDSTTVVESKPKDVSYDHDTDLTDTEARSSYNLIFYLIYRFITNNPLTNKHRPRA